jgi:hypothetical protein
MANSRLGPRWASAGSFGDSCAKGLEIAGLSVYHALTANRSIACSKGPLELRESTMSANIQTVLYQDVANNYIANGATFVQQYGTQITGLGGVTFNNTNNQPNIRFWPMV